MNTLTPHRKRLAGFSLVEMAIVILIAGIMMGAGLPLLAVKQEAAKWDVTKKNQEAIKQALINYLGKNRRLPCPGDSTGAELGRNAAPPPCPSYTGIVPYKELGLDRAAALDGWENFTTYVVSPNITLPVPLVPAPLLTTAWLYTYNSATASNSSPYIYTQTTNPANPGPIAAVDLAFWPSTSTGGIKVTSDGTNTIADPVNATGAAVVLISYGKNGYGANNVKGKNAPPPAANTYEVQNAASSVVTAGVIKRDSTETFDDIVMMLSASDLTGPLIANGTLPSNAQAALSQANDIVMGSIVASRAPYCPPTLTCPVPDPYTGYFYLVPTSMTSTPPNVAAWGVTYTSGAATTINATLPAAGNAYTLTAGDGATKAVSVGELRGILTRGAGF